MYWEKALAEAKGGACLKYVLSTIEVSLRLREVIDIGQSPYLKLSSYPTGYVLGAIVDGDLTASPPGIKEANSTKEACAL